MFVEVDDSRTLLEEDDLSALPESDEAFLEDKESPSVGAALVEVDGVDLSGFFFIRNGAGGEECFRLRPLSLETGCPTKEEDMSASFCSF